MFIYIYLCSYIHLYNSSLIGEQVTKLTVLETSHTRDSNKLEK